MNEILFIFVLPLMFFKCEIVKWKIIQFLSCRWCLDGVKTANSSKVEKRAVSVDITRYSSSDFAKTIELTSSTTLDRQLFYIEYGKNYQSFPSVGILQLRKS